MPRRLLPAPIVTAACLALLTPCRAAAEDSAEPAGQRHETVVREIRHVDVKEMNALVRTVLSLRKVGIDEKSSRLIVSDTPPQLRAFEALVEKLDQPRPAWALDLVAVGPDGEKLVKAFALEDETLTVRFGSSVEGRESLELTLGAHRVSSMELQLDYAVKLALPGARGRGSLHFAENGLETLAPGASLELARATSPQQGDQLAALVGVAQPVSELVLRAR